jgi:hypothetical protein
MMPPQLERGLRLKRQSGRTEQRPLAECLPHINVNDLQIPRDHKTYTFPNISLRYPHISGMRLNAFMVKFAHSERIQTFNFKWIKTGFGYPRPTFICECGRPVIKLYFKSTNLACRRCCNATYASRACSKNQRPALQAKRLQSFLTFKPFIRSKARKRLQARIRLLTLMPQRAMLITKRINDKAQLPQLNYNTAAEPLWR